MKLSKTLIASTTLALMAALPAFAQENNTLTDAEKADGWQLLFDGKSMSGWHHFHKHGVPDGWKIEDEAMVNPHGAGDICTDQQFDWFVLELDYRISADGNSGIMYHVTDKGGAIWATGPEFQLEDNATAEDPQRCGWLYALYQPTPDPATGKPLDATKPANQWNHVKIVISPQKCEHWVNGVKYLEYTIHSPDFNERVAKSKFGKMPGFAVSDTGYIGFQGDHPGAVSFRNVKIKPLKQ